MRIQRLFVIDWIPDHTLSPESLAVRSGLVKPAKKGIRFDCISPDEDAIDDQSVSHNSASFPMWLCDGSSRIVPCGPTMCDSILVRIESPEETQARERVRAIEMTTNRREFDLHLEFQVSPRTVFLDRDGPGDTFCQLVQVEVIVGTYAELPDYVAQMGFFRFFCAAARRTTIERPAWLPVEVSTEDGCERTPGILELVRSCRESSRRFDARIYT
ncbi:MAG TPA: hypothetical protein VGP63_26965 [Planctomycetaceae bacterium]|nr:hypothetical protein [Planctomycetaceae bacterium]